MTGDAVNTAARLEQTAGAGDILIGDNTYALVRDAVVVGDVDPLDVKGKAAPLLAYRLLEVRPGAEGHARRMDSPMVGRERPRRLQTPKEPVDGQHSSAIAPSADAGRPQRRDHRSPLSSRAPRDQGDEDPLGRDRRDR